MKSHRGSLPAALFHCFTFLTHNFSGVCFSCLCGFVSGFGEGSLCVILNVKIDMEGHASPQK